MKYSCAAPIIFFVHFVRIVCGHLKLFFMFLPLLFILAECGFVLLMARQACLKETAGAQRHEARSAINNKVFLLFFSFTFRQWKN